MNIALIKRLCVDLVYHKTVQSTRQNYYKPHRSPCPLLFEHDLRNLTCRRCLPPSDIFFSCPRYASNKDISGSQSHHFSTLACTLSASPTQFICPHNCVFLFNPIPVAVYGQTNGEHQLNCIDSGDKECIVAVTATVSSFWMHNTLGQHNLIASQSIHDRNPVRSTIEIDY